MGIPALSICAILAIVPLLWLPELPSPKHRLGNDGWRASACCMAKQSTEVCGYDAVILCLGHFGRAGEHLADAAFNNGGRAG